MRWAATILLWGCLCGGPAWADGVRAEALTIPAQIGPTIFHLQALMVRPDDTASHKLALITHGTPRNQADRAGMTPDKLKAQATAFASNGWTAVVVMRRGYGMSEGPYVEASGACNNPRYVASGRISAEDLAAAARFLITLPDVAPGPWISVGVSAGGFATIALTADPPPGLAAGIVFAPGRGSIADDVVCLDDWLVDAFASFGKTSRLPVLWISAANDHYFGPALVSRMRAAFTAAGGNLRFVGVPNFGADGHALFNRDRGVPIWAPIVERFLRAQQFAPR